MAGDGRPGEGMAGVAAAGLRRLSGTSGLRQTCRAGRPFFRAALAQGRTGQRGMV